MRSISRFFRRSIVKTQIAVMKKKMPMSSQSNCAGCMCSHHEPPSRRYRMA